MNFALKIVATGLTVSTAGFSVSAQDITLTSQSGGISITGKLIEYDGESYQVETELGRMTLADNDLICDGEACPDQSPKLDNFSLLPTDRVNRETLVSLLKAYAQDNQKLYSQQGPYSKPDLIELAHPTDGPEATIAFKSGQNNVTFNAANPDAPPLGFEAVKIISTAPSLDGKISAEALKQIWSGSISNWSELGGDSDPIRLIMPIYSDDLFAATQRFDADLSRDTATESVEYFLSTKAIQDAVRNDPSAIGLVYDTSEFNNAVAIELGCSMVIKPSNHAIQSMQYPLAFTMNINSDTNTQIPTIESFKAFVRTAKAQTIINNTGLVSLVGEEIGTDGQLQRLTDALNDVNNDTNPNDIQRFISFAQANKRLATTLYFDQEGRELDIQSEQILGPLRGLLQSARFSGSEIFAVGFSDSVGPARDNIRVSTERANLVKDALGSEISNIKVVGFGEVAPIGCNDTDYGKSKNRRVEIWYKP